MSKRILLVDDDSLIRQSLGETLSAAGFEVKQATDGQDGLTKALAEKPDLIISDILMPGMDGLSLVKKLREDEWGKKVPIIILSTDETTVSINQALTAGVTLYLSKSTLSPDQIAEQIKQAL